MAAHGKELAALGKKALIVTGRSSAKKTGALQDVTAALESNRTGYVIFDRVEENPSIETVMQARDLAVAEQVDFCIGIGGGSPMDAAKAIALMAANPGNGYPDDGHRRSLQGGGGGYHEPSGSDPPPISGCR